MSEEQRILGGFLFTGAGVLLMLAWYGLGKALVEIRELRTKIEHWTGVLKTITTTDNEGICDSGESAAHLATTALKAENDAMRVVLNELRHSLSPTYRLSPEGRAYIAKMDSALTGKEAE